MYSIQQSNSIPYEVHDGFIHHLLVLRITEKFETRNTKREPPAEKEVRGSPTHRQPKQYFCINQNQCILLLWSQLIRRIILSTGLISFQWIVHHLFVNTYMYLLDNNFICWIALSTLWWYSKHPQNWNGQRKLGSNSRQLFQTNLWHFLAKKQISPSAKGILTDKYPDANLEWDKVYYCYV